MTTSGRRVSRAIGTTGAADPGSSGAGAADATALRGAEAPGSEGTRRVQAGAPDAAAVRGAEHLLRLIETGFAEDVGTGDRTTEWTVPRDRMVTARIIARANGVICGMEPARLTFARVDPALRVDVLLEDGATVAPGDLVLRLEGSARAILTGERLALNFLQRLSGVATLTRKYVDAIAGTGAKVLDTRKTTPGLRALEKHAVAAGGGGNHRFGLYDMVLIKENHIRAAEGIAAAVGAVRSRNSEGLMVEVETTCPDEVRQALDAGVDRILLDNMPVEMLRESVALVRASGTGIETEASGGITLANVREVALTGVDWISVGSLTHSAPALDLSLLIDE